MQSDLVPSILSVMCVCYAGMCVVGLGRANKSLGTACVASILLMRTLSAERHITLTTHATTTHTTQKIDKEFTLKQRHSWTVAQ